MNDPYVLKVISKQLAISDMFHNLNGRHAVITDIVGVETSHRDVYLSGQRSEFILPLLSGKNAILPYCIEAILHILVKYWNDSYKRYSEGNDGVGMDGVRWSVIKTYYNETKEYIALVYNLFLLHPSDEYIDLEELYSGINRSEIVKLIAESGNLTLKRIEKLEHNMRVKAGKEITPGKYVDIPACGVPLIDNIQNHFGDKELYDTSNRQAIEEEFRQVCRSIARNNQSSQEEKIIWVRAAINTLNQTYVIANSLKDYPGINLTVEFCAILESEFLQIPNPICVKKIAIEIGMMDVFEEKVLNLLGPDGESPQVDYLCASLLDLEMGVTGEFYQRIVCKNCVVQNCPYDIYLRMYQATGEDNEKFRSLTPEEAATIASEEQQIVFPQLDGVLAQVQSYIEALYPIYVNKELKWRKHEPGVTNYQAYWLAFIFSKLHPEIRIQKVGDFFGINNLRTYSTKARLSPQIKDGFRTLFASKHLAFPEID